MYIQHCSTTTLYITQESCGLRASWWGRQALNISQPLVDDCSHDCIYASQGAKGKSSQSEDRWMKWFERWIMHTGSWYKVNISYLLLHGTKSKTLNCEKLWQERKNCVRVWDLNWREGKRKSSRRMRVSTVQSTDFPREWTNIKYGGALIIHRS